MLVSALMLIDQSPRDNLQKNNIVKKNIKQVENYVKFNTIKSYQCHWGGGTALITNCRGEFLTFPLTSKHIKLIRKN